jgi:hypothetical protein
LKICSALRSIFADEKKATNPTDNIALVLSVILLTLSTMAGDKSSDASLK